jgi:hypothetical protein
MPKLVTMPESVYHWLMDIAHDAPEMTKEAEQVLCRVTNMGPEPEKLNAGLDWFMCAYDDLENGHQVATSVAIPDVEVRSVRFMRDAVRAVRSGRMQPAYYSVELEEVDELLSDIVNS